MNSKERVKAAFHFNKPDKIPISCLSLKSDFFPVRIYPPKSWQPIDYPPHVPGGVDSISKPLYRLFIYRWKRGNRIRAGYARKWWQYPHKSIDEWRNMWKSSGTKSEDITRGHPYQGFLHDNWDELENFEPPDLTDKKRYRILKTYIWKLLGRKRYTIGELVPNGFFALCSQIRGFSNFLIDLVRHPKQVEQLINKLLPYFITLITKYKEYYSSLDSVMVADDLGTQKSPFISPSLFQKFFKKPYKKIIELAHDFNLDFILHSCGEILELMPDIIDMGVDVFEFDSPHMVGVENIKKIAKQKKVAFWLSSNIQSTYTLGTPEEIEEEIKLYIKEVGNNQGGLAIYEYMSKRALGTPKQNVIAQRESVRKWGNYDEEGKIDWIKS
ncbi:MAG: putative Methylcobalamin:coenzyme M methyltransferase [Promethearchaeota archaeon]|nr:MAG: putative Methylcobalamin:coenzyme M methyltransferase [Candidatus Lokiarchaeota archaeon]